MSVRSSSISSLGICTFDAAYCFLLLTIERLWDISDSDERKRLILGNMFTIMMGILPPIAKFLISQPLPAPYEKNVAAPCFNYYDFCNEPPLQKLLLEMRTTLDAYLNVKEETANQVTVHDFGPQLDVLLPIYNTMTKLVTLDDFTRIARPLVKNAGAAMPGAQSMAAKGVGRVVL